MSAEDLIVPAYEMLTCNEIFSSAVASRMAWVQCSPIHLRGSNPSSFQNGQYRYKYPFTVTYSALVIMKAGLRFTMGTVPQETIVPD